MQDVETPELLDRERDHLLDLGRIADVGVKRLGRRAGAANLAGDAVGAFFVEIDYEHCGAFRRETFRRRLTDSRS